MAKRLLVKPGGDARTPIRITPEDAGWEYVSLSVHTLPAGRSLTDRTGGEEVGIVLLGGRATVRSDAGTWEGIGRREDVFDGLPWAVYLPPGVEFEVHAETDVQFARGGAPAEKGVAPRLIRPDDVEVVHRGSGSVERRIHNILMGNLPAERLLLVEVLTPGGNWSSYPPHKHDTHRPPTRRRIWKKCTTIASGRPTGSSCSGSTTTPGSWIRLWPCPTARWCWCPGDITRWRRRPAATRIT